MTNYSETLRPSVGWWLLVIGFAVSTGWIFLVVSDWTVGTVVGIVTTAALAVPLWIAGSLRIDVRDGDLLVGGARLPGAAVGAATALDREMLRHIRGAGADARAFSRIRSYVPTGVKVGVNDPHDPTPYWLVSTRRPDALVASLATADKDQRQPIGEEQRVEEEQ